MPEFTGAPGMWSDFNQANRSAMMKSELISWPVTLAILVLLFLPLAALLPTLSHDLVMLDLGANLSCDADNLVQFAIMGSALVSSVDGIERPTIGLLNVGNVKGTMSH